MRYIILISVLIMSACSAEKNKESDPVIENSDSIVLSDEQYRNAGVEVMPVREDTLVEQLNVNGVADVPPQNLVSISFPLGGYLKSTRLMPGSKVQRGQVLAIIEDASLVQLQQDYLVVKAKLGFTNSEYARQATLKENNVNAGKVFERAEADLAEQKVQLKGYSEKLRLIGINPESLTEQTISRQVAIPSPIDGYVSKVNVNIGKYVNPSDVLFELINPNDIHAALTVFEKDMSKVGPGQRVQVRFVDDPDVVHDAEVFLVTRNIDSDRSALVHCHFEKQPKKLLPGMFLNASISTGNTKGLVVPEEALVREGNKQYVLEEVGQRTFKLVPVITGVKQNGMVSVKGLEEDLADKRIIGRNAYGVFGAMRNRTE